MALWSGMVRKLEQRDASLCYPATEMHYLKLLEHVEHLIRDVVRTCCPTSWDEDHITFSITDRLGQLGNFDVTGLQRPFKIRWDARKLRGPTETALGDLGVLVRFTAWDGEQIEGIGLLEAKKRSLSSSSFDAVRKSQLTKIAKNAPRSRLLLYDHTGITEFTDNLSIASMARPICPWFGPYWHDYIVTPCQYSYAVALPIHLALRIGNYKTSLYKYSIPLSVQLCGRYFRAQDLEFDPKVLDRVKGYIDGAGGPRYLLLIGVSTGPQPPAMPEGLADFYVPLDQQHD